MKLVVIPNSLDHLEEYKKIGAGAFIFALKDFSSGYNFTISLDTIKELIDNNSDVEIFVSINKNIFNEELDELENILIELDKTNVKGVLFYDMSLISIKNKHNLKLDLVWNQTHMVTNYNTCNYYYGKNVKYGYLAGEITLDEINEIVSKTSMKLFATVFGYPIMSFTRRSLLTNYFISSNNIKQKDTYVVTNNNEEYLVNEEDSGNSMYYGKILNGSVVLNSINTEYVVLNEYNVDYELFVKVLKLYKGIIDTKDESLIGECDNLLGNYRGFFFQKTIYKVKKDE